MRVSSSRWARPLCKSRPKWPLRGESKSNLEVTRSETRARPVSPLGLRHAHEINSIYMGPSKAPAERTQTSEETEDLALDPRAILTDLNTVNMYAFQSMT